jgi:hypothetical protein
MDGLVPLLTGSFGLNEPCVTRKSHSDSARWERRGYCSGARDWGETLGADVAGNANRGYRDRSSVTDKCVG